MSRLLARLLPPLPADCRWGDLDRKAASALIVAALMLTAQNYFGHPSSVVRVVGHPDVLMAWERDPLARLSWWAGVAVLTYFGVPALVVRLVWRERLADYGFKLGGIGRGWRLYGVFLAVMVPLVVVCSSESRFRATYPFYKPSPGEGWSAALVRWELLYAAQFVALEFFFRGFLLHALRPSFGLNAVFVAAVPYCMIHFGKPLPECVASVAAGLALGYMSLATRSIGLGAALHVAVAWGMDAACLWRGDA